MTKKNNNMKLYNFLKLIIRLIILSILTILLYIVYKHFNNKEMFEDNDIAILTDTDSSTTTTTEPTDTDSSTTTTTEPTTTSPKVIINIPTTTIATTTTEGSNVNLINYDISNINDNVDSFNNASIIEKKFKIINLFENIKLR